MANPGTPNLAPAGPAPSMQGMGDDNFAQRIGIGLAVSLGVNFALFAGASLMARTPTITVDSKMHYVAVPSPKPSESATPAPTPSVAPTAKPTVAAKPTPKPEVKPTPAVKPTPHATPKPTVSTPKPATPKPVVQPSAVIPTPVVRPSTQPSVAVHKTVAPVVITKSPTSIKVDPNMATPPPSVVKDLSTYRAIHPTQLALGKTTGTRVTPPTLKTTSASSAVSPAPSGAAAGSHASAAQGAMRKATPAGALSAAPAAMAPIVVAPIVESQLSGGTRQLTTVSGVASHMAGRVAVVALSAKASSVSASGFVVPTSGGNLRAGTVTARQGSAAGAGATAMSGSPTIITTGAEYSVSAPGAPNHGVIGVRGNKSSLIGVAVTSLAGKGSSADVGAGVGVYGDAKGGNQRGAVGRAAVAAVGQSGALDTVGGSGLGPVGSGGGSGGSDRAGTQGVKGGNGSGVRGSGIGGNGGGVGANVAQGSGEAYGVPNGVPGGAIKANVSLNTTQTGKATVDTGQVVTNKATIKGNDTIVAPKIKAPDFDEVDEVSTDKAVTEVTAHTDSKPSWDPPNVRFSGTIEVHVTINPDGSHSEEFTRSTNVPELDSYLKRFFAGWRWVPGRVDGKSVKTNKIVRFKIN